MKIRVTKCLNVRKRWGQILLGQCPNRHIFLWCGSPGVCQIFCNSSYLSFMEEHKANVIFGNYAKLNISFLIFFPYYCSGVNICPDKSQTMWDILKLAVALLYKKSKCFICLPTIFQLLSTTHKCLRERLTWSVLKEFLYHMFVSAEDQKCY